MGKTLLKGKLMAFWLFLWVGIPFMLAQKSDDDIGTDYR
mgnify:CR=1 FL=1